MKYGNVAISFDVKSGLGLKPSIQRTTPYFSESPMEVMKSYLPLLDFWPKFIQTVLGSGRGTHIASKESF